MKATIHTRLFCMTLLLLALLLPLAIPAFATDGGTVSEEIPEGWEIVSKEDNVTQLRMKEGANAYKWYGDQIYSDPTQFIIEAELMGNPNFDALSMGDYDHINVIVYYGHCEVQRDYETNEYMLAEDFERNNPDYTLNMRKNYNASETVIELPGFAAQNSVVLQNLGDESEFDVNFGLGQAVIVSIPISSLSDGWDMIAFELTDDTDGVSNESVISTSKLGGKLHFTLESFHATRQSFPYVLMEHYGVVHCVLLCIVILLAVFCTVRRFNRIIPLIPCAVGCVFSVITEHYFANMPTSQGSAFSGIAFVGDEVTNFMCAIGYIILAVLVLILRAVVDKIRRKKAEQAASVPVPPDIPAE